MTIGSSSTLRTSGPGSSARGRVLFVGAVHEAEPALSALLDADVEVVGVATLAPGAASRTSGAVDLASLVEGRGTPVLATEDLNAPESVRRVRALSPDLIVVVGWTRLLSEELLGVPPRGCVGFHASLLPRHRGRAPVNWAILRGETVTGNTMMFLAARADEGDIIDQRPVTIEPKDTCATVYDKIARAGADMLRIHVRDLLAGTVRGRSQAHSATGALPKRTPEMGITDWVRPAREVHDWIRALTHPYPGAFTRLEGRRVFLWRSEVPGAEEPEGAPGTILGAEGETMRVGTRWGSLAIARVQEEGEPEEAGASWLARRGLTTGVRFDPVDEATRLWALGLGPRPAARPTAS